MSRVLVLGDKAQHIDVSRLLDLIPSWLVGTFDQHSSASRSQTAGDPFDVDLIFETQKRLD